MTVGEMRAEVPEDEDEKEFSLGFQEPAVPYTSGSQLARVWTERWVHDWAFCPNCRNSKFSKFANNHPAADFYCQPCGESFELKSTKGKFGAKVLDGAYSTMRERLASNVGPNLALLSYSAKARAVRDFMIIPKQFFTSSIIEERAPLASTARRAGWIGCKIRLNEIPASGKIFVVRDGVLRKVDEVAGQWRKTLFLREQSTTARGWLLEVLRCCELIGSPEFSLADVYRFENRLAAIYPQNRHIRHKIRQQLQVLRDNGVMEFRSRGRYRLR